jgi:hypothetical protein
MDRWDPEIHMGENGRVSNNPIRLLRPLLNQEKQAPRYSAMYEAMSGSSMRVLFELDTGSPGDAQEIER